MTDFRRVGERGVRYRFRADECIGLECFQPGMFQHRGATSSGSRNTGSPDSPCCMARAYRGCPSDGDPLRVFKIDLAKTRKAEGWRRA